VRHPLLIFFLLNICNLFAQHTIRTDLLNGGLIDSIDIQSQQSTSGESAQNTQLQRNYISIDRIYSAPGVQTNYETLQTIHQQKRDIILPVLLLFVLVYLTWIRFTYPKEFSENIIILTNINLAQQMFRDREFSLNIFMLLLFINFAIVAGILLHLITENFGLQLPFSPPIYNIGLCIFLIVAVYVLKGIFYRTISAIFDISTGIRFFRYNTLVIYHMLGIALLPFVMLTAFAESPFREWAFFAALLLCALAFLIRFFKGLVIAEEFLRFRFLYFLLYICALEIAPVLIACKLLSFQA
jgi:hypothetical protein